MVVRSQCLSSGVRDARDDLDAEIEFKFKRGCLLGNRCAIDAVMKAARR
jgi:hypothetical protein